MNAHSLTGIVSLRVSPIRYLSSNHIFARLPSPSSAVLTPCHLRVPDNYKIILYNTNCFIRFTKFNVYTSDTYEYGRVGRYWGRVKWAIYCIY